MQVLWRLLLVALPGLSICCGGRQETQVDPEPFREALVHYLKAGSMQMEPDAFLSIEVEGETAVAEVRMATSGEMGYGLKPKWTVTFKREGKGWKVASVER